MSERPVLSGEGATDYERYLRVGTLLSLQKRPEELANHDEHLFQIMHQTFELWLHQLLFDVEEMDRRMAKDNPVGAARLAERAVEITRTLTKQFDVLATMHAWDYQQIRVALGRGSGQESPGFNRVLARAPKLQTSYLDMLKRRGVTLDDLNMRRAKEPHEDLVLLGEHLIAFDEAFIVWRERHLAFVKRMIGQGQKSLKGYSVEALEKHIRGHAFFPELWALRDTMTLEAGTSPPGKTPERRA